MERHDVNLKSTASLRAEARLLTQTLRTGTLPYATVTACCLTTLDQASRPKLNTTVAVNVPVATAART